MAGSQAGQTGHSAVSVYEIHYFLHKKHNIGSSVCLRRGIPGTPPHSAAGTETQAFIVQEQKRERAQRHNSGSNARLFEERREPCHGSVLGQLSLRLPPSTIPLPPPPLQRQGLVQSFFDHCLVEIPRCVTWPLPTAFGHYEAGFLPGALRTP